MAGFKMDADGVAAYAETMRSASDRLAEARSAFTDGGLSAGTFGAVSGQNVVVDAYARAAGALLAQLNAGAQALESASGTLRVVAASQAEGDANAAAKLKKIKDAR
ncbi:hypothetical protein [Amycolatopsis minnesotensis]|uniref:Excreted virulence factor EspC (Type VII ESX diderm) n=1 Tax=Amycolatopsis minnesotensis TaxID=337894 RepID=A0ABN2Q8U2_9PSEU